MRKIIVLAGAVSLALALFGCALAVGSHVSNPENFKGKTGVIGVFRQAAFYCGENIPHYMTLGGTSVVVKPGFSSSQDNLFVGEIKPGVATLTNYQYTCGGEENNMSLDTTGSGKERFPVSVVVPDSGFCKIVISFLDGDKLFSHNGKMLKEFFEKEKVALDYERVPFCEVLDNKGGKVFMLDKDSILDAQFMSAVNDAQNAEEDEKFTLVTMEQNSDKVAWDAVGDKALMVVFTAQPDSFKDEASMKLNRELIAVNEREFFQWFKNNKDGVHDWALRFKQLFGYSRKADLTHFSLIWVSPKDMLRPAYVPNVMEPLMNTSFEGMNADGIDPAKLTWFKNWFEAEKAKIYNPDGRAWTRLGYTYDWNGKNGEYGLSEFLILPGAEVEVKFTKNIRAFANWMSDRN